MKVNDALAQSVAETLGPVSINGGAMRLKNGKTEITVVGYQLQAQYTNKVGFRSQVKLP